jgi:hypothetical protein
MTFSLLNSFFTALLPLAALPVLFHLFFRLKQPRRTFPTLMFFRRIDPKLNARRRLRAWLILLLRTLLILCLLFALAKPVWFGVGHAGAVAVVLVLDNSGSMSGAGSGAPTKLKQAVEAAQGVLRQLRARDAAGVLLVVPDPAVPLPLGLSEDKAALKTALDRVGPTEASGSIAAALERAGALLAAKPTTHGEIHILSDLQAAKWSQPPVSLRAPRAGTRIVVHRIASPAAQQPAIAIAGVQPPRRAVPAGRHVPLEIQLANPGPVGGRVRMNWQDDAGNRGSAEVAVPARGETSATVTLDAPNPGRRWALFGLEGDAFPAGARAAVAFTVAEKQTVLFAGQPADFGTLALAISPGGDGQLSGLVPTFSDADALASALLEQRPSFVVLTWDALARKGVASPALEKFLAAGGRLLLVPSPSASGAPAPPPPWLSLTPESLRSVSNGLALTALDQANSMFTDLRDEQGEVVLPNLKAFKFLALRLAPTNTPVLGLEDGRVVFAEQRVGQGLVLGSGLAFDPNWSTLPLKPGFVALAQGMALAPAPTGTNLVSAVAGESLRLAPADAGTIQVQSLGGGPLDWQGAAAELSTLPRAGLYSVRTGDKTTFVAVRAADREAQQTFLTTATLPALGPLKFTLEDLASGDALVSAVQVQEKSLDLSLPLLLLAFLCLALEGWMANPPPLKSRATAPGAAANLPATP